jgi:hypothetical protein
MEETNKISTIPKTAPKKNIAHVGKYTIVDLEKLEDIRKIWKREAQDFTKWMSLPENISRLGDALGLEIDPDSAITESKSGPSNRRCDIVARLKTEEEDDEECGEIIAIENQLEATDFSHLGRLILYAALENATRIVWVVKEATYDCRKAIAWLNRNTADSLRFYLVEVVVYDLKENQVAPVFRLVEWPDEEEKVQKSGTPKRRANLAFWQGFLDFLNEEAGDGSRRATRELGCINSFCRPSPENWYRVAIGSSKCHINLEYSNTQVKIVVLTEDVEKNSFKKLMLKHEDMQRAIGKNYKTPMVKGEDVKQPLFRYFGPKCDIMKSEDNHIEEAYNWLANGLSKIVPIVKESLNIN